MSQLNHNTEAFPLPPPPPAASASWAAPWATPAPASASPARAGSPPGMGAAKAVAYIIAQLIGAAIGALLLAIIVNWLFLQSGLFGFLISSAVVLVFSAITAYETQMIKNLYQSGPGGVEANKRSSIMGAFMLYGSFATLFIHILNILGFMRE